MLHSICDTITCRDSVQLPTPLPPLMRSIPAPRIVIAVRPLMECGLELGMPGKVRDFVRQQEEQGADLIETVLTDNKTFEDNKRETRGYGGTGTWHPTGRGCNSG